MEGFFRCRVRVDEMVDARQIVGELTDLVGEPVAAIAAPVSGVVLFTVTSPAVKKDGLLLAIGSL